MVRTIRILPGLCLAVLTGCAVSPLFQLERSALERALPPDVAMSDYVEKDWFGKVTVEEKLARLGAYTEGDGKIRDGTGKEIRFVKHEERSLKASPELLKQEQEKERELKQYCRVIEVRPDPDLKPGPAAPERNESRSTAAAPAQQASKPAATPPAPAWQPAASPGPAAPVKTADTPPVSQQRTDTWQPAR